MSNAPYMNFSKNKAWFKRWDSKPEHCSYRGPGFLAPTWWLTTVFISSSRNSLPFLVYVGTKHTCDVYSYMQASIHTHKKEI